jgi:hypothetical protein
MREIFRKLETCQWRGKILKAGFLVMLEDDKNAMILTYMARIGPRTKKNKKN